MEIIKEHSKLHKELQLQEYLIPFKELDKIETKEEFINYVKYYKLDIYFISGEKTTYKFLAQIESKEEFMEFIEKFGIRADQILQNVEQYTSKEIFIKHLEYVHYFAVLLMRRGIMFDTGITLHTRYFPPEYNPKYKQCIFYDLKCDNLLYGAKLLKFMQFFEVDGEFIKKHNFKNNILYYNSIQCIFVDENFIKNE